MPAPEPHPPSRPAAAGRAPQPERGGDADIDELIAQLHQEMDLEPTTTAAPDAPLTSPTDVSRPERAPAVELETAGGIDFDPAIPSWGAKAGGLAVDAAALVLALAPGLVIAVVGGSALLVVLGIAVGTAGLIAATVSYARAIADCGQWIGNRVAGTRVVDARNGRLLDAPHAAVRFLIRFGVSPFLLLGFLVALGNRQRRTFHDSAIGSVVTCPPRATWSAGDTTS